MTAYRMIFHFSIEIYVVGGESTTITTTEHNNIWDLRKREWWRIICFPLYFSIMYIVETFLLCLLSIMLCVSNSISLPPSLPSWIAEWENGKILFKICMSLRSMQRIRVCTFPTWADYNGGVNKVLRDWTRHVDDYDENVPNNRHEEEVSLFWIIIFLEVNAIIVKL